MLVRGFLVGSLWFYWVFLCGLAELLLCIHPVYLGAPYAFLMKFSYLSKKKKVLLFIKKISKCISFSYYFIYIVCFDTFFKKHHYLRKSYYRLLPI
jgi:hypothetical protein